MWKAPKKIKQVKKPSPRLRTSQVTWARSNVEKARAFAEHLANVFHLHPSENEPEDEEAFVQRLETPTNSNHQSTVSKELKFKKSSAAEIIRNHRDTTSSVAKFLKNCISLE
jgi:hypothetical protein